MTTRAWRTAAAAIAALLLLLPASLPGQARRAPAGTAVQVRSIGGALLIAAPFRQMAVRIESAPLSISVDGAGGRSLIEESVGPDALVFDLDRAALAPLLHGRGLGLPSTGPLAVHALKLLRWQTVADGASLVAATDDPLERPALIAVRFPAPGVAAFQAQLSDQRAVVSSGLAVRSGPDEHFFGLGEQFGG